LIGDRDIQDAVVRSVLVGRADHRALGTGAVVAADVDDQRVVEFAHIVDRLDYAADFVVGIGRIAGEHFRLPGKELPLVGSERIPFFQVVGPGGELRIRGNDPQLLLVGEDLLAHGVPAHVELALELVNPFFLWVVRRVASAPSSAASAATAKHRLKYFVLFSIARPSISEMPITRNKEPTRKSHPG
jgi:hypothetical protein